MCKDYLFMLLLVLSVNSANTQPPLDWAEFSTVGGGFQDFVEDVYVDGSGNTYACGTFRGALTIGSDNLFASGAGQVFVAKFNASGTPLWAIQSTGNSQALAKSIITDDLGNVYVAGYHSHNTLGFAGLSLISAAKEGFYILKISPTGLPLYLNGPTSSTTGKSQAWGIVTDGDSVYVTGMHRAAVDLPGGSTLGATAGQGDVFIASIDSALTAFGYAYSHGSTETDIAHAITMNGNDLFITGKYGNSSCIFTTSGTDYTLPAYGHEAVFLANLDKTTGAVKWATSAGSANGNNRANDLVMNGSSVLITGACSDICTFVETPSTNGPFTYTDTVYSNGATDIFVARYNAGGIIQDVWSEGGPLEDEAFGITNDSNCTEIQLCGGFRDSINFGGSTPLIANQQDIFVAAYDSTGVFKWAFKEYSAANEFATSISSNTSRTSLGGMFYGDLFFSTVPLTEADWNGFNDHFVSSFQCGNAPPCGPTITNCVENDTVISDATCTHVLGDYTGSITVNDGCSTGITITQSPPPLSILNAGTHDITLIATDGNGKNDVCLFKVVVASDVSPVLVECGDSFVNESTAGQSNTISDYSCTATQTPGEDVIYQITVPAGNHFLQVQMQNVIDSNDDYAYAYWMDDNCPNFETCAEVDSFNISAGKFSNQSEYLSYIADGPGTYYFVVDAKTDHIDSYDIHFSCNNSGVQLDNSGCTVQDADSDGIVSFKNGSAVTLSVQPCETVTICHDLYLANLYDWEWVDSVELKLGDCYENINTTTLSPNAPPDDNGVYDANGEWYASYNAGSNIILWEFEHSSDNPWGDGNSGQYNCNLYSFCFEADISAGCPGDEELTIGIVIGDDGGKGEGSATNVFDIGNSNDFTLQDDNPYFSYPVPVLCNGDPNTAPDSITTSGGTFTADPGVVFTDGSPSATGEIDLMASTIGGPYTITYEVGLCPFTYDFIVDINAQQNPAFSYSSTQYCQGDTDPTPTVSGTSGGIFTAASEIVFISSASGEIDLSASTAGGPYYVKYTTPGPYCQNTDSVQITIDAEDVPTFNYPSINYCKNDPNPSPAFVVTAGGTFSESTTSVTINSSTGEIDLAASPTGNYYITYTTNGICPNPDSVVFIINPEDDPSFSYPAANYCQEDTDPTPTITGTTGGTFSGPTEITFLSATTGEIDLSASTAGGPYNIIYTTPGPSCPNVDTFNITIHPEDDPSFSYASNDFCQGDTIQTAVINGTNGGSFTASAEIDLLNPTTGAFDPAGSTAGGPYTITYTTPGPNCPNTENFTLYIYPEDDPSMNYGDLTYCSEDNNPVPTLIMSGGSFSAPSEVVFVSTATGEIDLSASTPGGPFEIVYTTPGPECPNSDTFNITIIAQDQALFSYGDTTFCTSEISVAPTITGTPSGYFNSINPLLLLDTLSGEINLLSTTEGNYTITYITSGICPDTNSTQLSVYLQPIANAGEDQELFFLYETQLQAVPANSGTGIWSIIQGGGNIADPTDSTSLITQLESGINLLEWSVANGSCPTAIDEVQITVNALFIPQALTPNNDGDNDLFVIEGIELLAHKIEIFNRWGQKVFESEQYENNWDGTDDSGNELSADTYFYIITAKDQTFKGYVVIKR
ncbi:MAG: gliding motility-associated C-terminal domain-containing protein [Crocinitomicaceae bacterium]